MVISRVNRDSVVDRAAEALDVTERGSETARWPRDILQVWEKGCEPGTALESVRTSSAGPRWRLRNRVISKAVRKAKAAGVQRP
jgi:hypothetical protein